MTSVPNTNLLTGTGSIPIPQLGFGVWQIPADDVEAAVRTALDVGYRHIDTAAIYHNEEGVGKAIAASAIPRDELFVTTKVWNADQGSTRTLAAFDKSMTRLGLDILDLYLIHWPAAARKAYVETWRTLLELRASGRVRSVGVCNFHIPHLERLREETGEFPAINQIELHPYLQQRELRDFHAEHGIVTEAYSPLASGQEVLDDPVIAEIADKHNVTPAQAILAWHIEIDNVVIPKSVTPARIAENFSVLDIALDEEDLARLAALDRGMRTGENPDEFEG